MALYVARIQTRTGLTEVELDAKDDREARRQAQRYGRVLTVSKKTQWGFTRGLTPAERQTFLQRLSAMLASRVGAGEALRLIRDTFKGRVRWVAGTLLRKIEAGADIGEGMDDIGMPDFPSTTVALIKAGSQGGETWRALADAAGFEVEMSYIKRSAGKGIWSGIGGFLIAAAVTLGSTLYVGPKVMSSKIISAQADTLSTGWVDVLAVVMNWTMFILLGVFAFLFLLGSVGRRLVPKQADNLILKIPFYKDLILSRNNFMVLYGLALLINSGVRIEEALRLSQESSPPGAMREDLKRALGAVRNGQPWAMAMDTLHPTDKAALATSQDRKQVANALDALSRQYRELYAQRIASFVPALQMLAALFLSLSGLVLFGMSILPMLQATTGML